MIQLKGTVWRACAGTFLAAALVLPSAQAGLIFTGGGSVTSYGVAPYGGAPNNIAPTYIGNNVTTAITGRNDILTSPDGGFLTANPVVANNIASYALPYNNYTFQIGGGNGFGPFGAADTLVTPTLIGFDLADSVPGGGSASYMITSTDTTFTADAFGFLGNLGSFLAIRGNNPFGNDAVASSLITEYSINGGGWVYVPQLVLAAAGGGNSVAIGPNGAFMANTAVGFGGTFQGAAFANWGAIGLAPGNTIRVISTLTAYADPASFDSFLPDNGLLLDNGIDISNVTLLSSDATDVPEPGAFMLMGAGLLGVGLIRRRKKA